MIAASLRALERFLLPNACVACERLVETGSPDALVCAVCRSRFRPLVGGCTRCHQPLPPVGPCRFCRNWTTLAEAHSAVWLNEVARAVVHALKYEGFHKLGDVAAATIVRHVTRPARGLLMPIPLAPGRLRLRGYNQAAVLARALGRAWALPVAEHIVRRTRETGTQTALTPEARAQNVADAFAARKPSAKADVILVDDVMTTGATLGAAAAALHAAGWTTVNAVTFARALPFELRAEPTGTGKGGDRPATTIQ